MEHLFSGNKGEWSEPYVLLKLLADGKIYLGDGRLNKIEEFVLPILNILREEQYGVHSYGYSQDKQRVIFKLAGDERLFEIEKDKFHQNAVELLKQIKSQNTAAFQIPNVEDFLKQIGCTRLSAKSASKSDIHIVVHDVRNGVCPTLGFSIKSELGSKPTLLNASGATNFLYEISNCTTETAQKINTLNNSRGSPDIRARMAVLYDSGCILNFSDISSRVFANNLILIDSRLPEILAAMLCSYYSGHATTVQDLAAKVCASNPNNYDRTNQHRFYEYKIKRLLCETALGMRPAEVWHGNYDATGGYLVVKEDGEIVCYHLYNWNQFENYLFLNTKFETPSSSRHQFGSIFEENKKFFLKLNLQIRFI